MAGEELYERRCWMSRYLPLGRGKTALTLFISGVIVLGSLAHSVWATPAQDAHRAHQQRRRHPLAGHVADEEGPAAVRSLEEIV